MRVDAAQKYRPFPPVRLPDRQWPSRTLTQAPRWCSSDLRAGNQALSEIAQQLKKGRMGSGAAAEGRSAEPAAARAKTEDAFWASLSDTHPTLARRETITRAAAQRLEVEPDRAVLMGDHERHSFENHAEKFGI